MVYAAENRRIVLIGYPINKPFESAEEVREYLSEDKIVCLLCGREYHHLAVHLRTHDMTPDQYREKYHIPWTYALGSKSLREARREGMLKRMREGYKPDTPKPIGNPKRKHIQKHPTKNKYVPPRERDRKEANERDIEYLKAIDQLLVNKPPSLSKLSKHLGLRTVSAVAVRVHTYLVPLGLVYVRKEKGRNRVLVYLTDKGKSLLT